MTFKQLGQNAYRWCKVQMQTSKVEKILLFLAKKSWQREQKEEVVPFWFSNCTEQNPANAEHLGKAFPKFASLFNHNSSSALFVCFLDKRFIFR